MEEDKKFGVSANEQEILKFWKENKIFEKSIEKEAPNGDFVFFDGPPFATGTPHYGHILASAIKDAIPRYWTMRGKRVERKWGWDCHGLPIENIAEKELGIKEKKEILEMGIEKFNDVCRSKIFGYVDEWEKIIGRLGRWADMENAYKTMDVSYMESIWWVFKELWDKDLIYESYRSMHICPRCETTLSQQEVAEGYKDIKDISVTVKFELVDELGTFVLAWTTTPWTLPGNVALAVNSEIEYVKIKNTPESKKTEDGGELYQEEYYWVSKEIFEKGKTAITTSKEDLKLFRFLGHTVKSTEKITKGSDFIGKSYKPVFDHYSNQEDLENRERGWKIYGADFVNTEDGTGVVHIAPAFGEDDMNLGKKENLPFVQHVGIDGKFKDFGIKEFIGLPVKPIDTKEDKSAHLRTDIAVIKWLQDNEKFFSKEKITHTYPHCWRCDTPLLNYATSSWFVSVLKVKDRALELAKEISWSPEHLKEGRFGKWLEGARDWSISRQRFWASAIPLWKCEKCGELKVVGSIEELKGGAKKSSNKYFVMRHGEAEQNIANIVDAKLDDGYAPQLSEKGKKEIEMNVEKIKGEEIDLIFTSPFERTRATAEEVVGIIGLDKSKIIVEERIQEINVGTFNGKKSEEYHAYFNGYEEKFTKKPPEGENLTELKGRLMNFLEEIDSKYKNKKILIVSHECPIWILFAGANGLNQKETIAWKEEKGDDFIRTGELMELDYSPFPHNKNFELDLHRPYVDDFILLCEKCGGDSRRIDDVLDTWFDSGSMPYAQEHYPFENKERFDKIFPADFIGEGVDQTRAWFYYLHIIATAIKDSTSFKNVIVNGILLAEDGQKMSKRLRNYPDPMEVIEKYGADALRYYLLSSPAVRAESLNFSEKGVDEVYKKIILRLKNVVSFYEMYAGGSQSPVNSKQTQEKESENVLDQWILARLGDLESEVTENLDRYELDKATRPINDFVDDLSTWYIRRSRERFKSDDEKDKIAVLTTTKYVLLELSKIIAPFMPFIAEEVFQSVEGLAYGVKDRSVHLEEWPKDGLEIRDTRLGILRKMKMVRGIVSFGLEARAKAEIKVRQPLTELRIKNDELDIMDNEQLLGLIKDEINVKEIVLDKNIDGDVEFDTKITPELKEEGMVRDLIRSIQGLRKKLDLTPQEKVTLVIETDEEGKSFVEKFSEEIKKATDTAEIEFVSIDEGAEIKVGEIKLMVKFNK